MVLKLHTELEPGSNVCIINSTIKITTAVYTAVDWIITAAGLIVFYKRYREAMVIQISVAPMPQRLEVASRRMARDSTNTLRSGAIIAGTNHSLHMSRSNVSGFAAAAGTFQFKQVVKYNFIGVLLQQTALFFMTMSAALVVNKQLSRNVFRPILYTFAIIGVSITFRDNLFLISGIQQYLGNKQTARSAAHQEEKWQSEIH